MQNIRESEPSEFVTQTQPPTNIRRHAETPTNLIGPPIAQFGHETTFFSHLIFIASFGCDVANFEFFHQSLC